MIVIDTSAIFAILANEPERPIFLSALENADRRYVSALTFYETRVVALSRLGDAGLQALDRLVDEWSLIISPFNHAQAVAATEGYQRFGKGHGTRPYLICRIAPRTLSRKA